MHGIFTHIYPKNQPNVGKYSIHGASGTGFSAGSLFQHRKLPTESHLEKKLTVKSSCHHPALQPACEAAKEKNNKFGQMQKVFSRIWL